MIITKLYGGLGNQMFQYAAGISLAINNKCELKLDVSWFDLFSQSAGKVSNKVKPHESQTPRRYELDHFFIRSEFASKDEVSRFFDEKQKWFRRYSKFIGIQKTHHFVEQDFCFNSNLLKLKSPILIEGYWQSEKYFLEIENQIRSDFTFKTTLSKDNQVVAEKIRSVNSVSLHVRRNDYANNMKVKATHGLCSLKYYQVAIKYIAELVDKPHFFIFSDDITWAKTNLKINYSCEFVEHNFGSESYNDMRLMSLCQHHIIANSTFSWWGAWLNPRVKKIVIAPKLWFAKDSNTEDLIPQGWVIL